jgi:hypothetical protein
VVHLTPDFWPRLKEVKRLKRELEPRRKCKSLFFAPGLEFSVYISLFNTAGTSATFNVANSA